MHGLCIQGKPSVLYTLPSWVLGNQNGSCPFSKGQLWLGFRSSSPKRILCRVSVRIKRDDDEPSRALHADRLLARIHCLMAWLKFTVLWGWDFFKCLYKRKFLRVATLRNVLSCTITEWRSHVRIQAIGLSSHFEFHVCGRTCFICKCWPSASEYICVSACVWWGHGNAPLSVLWTLLKLSRSFFVFVRFIYFSF